MDYLFSVIMALVLLCSQNFIDIPILSYFGSITLLIFTFVLFVDLFPERYKNKKMIACFKMDPVKRTQEKKYFGA